MPYIIMILYNLVSIEASSQQAGSYTLVENVIYYQLGSTTLPIRTVQYGPQNGMLFINLHDNETTSVTAARSILPVVGGTLIKIDNDGERNIHFKLKGKSYAVDPNGIFSREGIRLALVETGNVSEEAIDEVEKLGKRILQLLPVNPRYVVALHNNTPDGYSILSYMRGGDLSKEAKEVHQVAGQDADDLFFTTEKKLYKAIIAAGYNCVWQDNKHASQDGSLSVYCGAHHIPYVNLETEQGKLEQYGNMLRQLLDLIN
jgi:hypothetical protein